MTPEKLEALERVSWRKQAWKVGPMAIPPILAVSTMDPPITSSLVLALIGGDSVPLVAQASTPPSGDVGFLEEVLMVVKNIPFSLEEAFMVKVIVLPEETPVETMEAIGSLEGMIGTTSPWRKS